MKHAPHVLRALWLTIVLMPLLVSAKEPQATIQDTGSTNRLGLTVSFDREGNAIAESRGGETRQIKLDASMCKRFVLDLEAVGPLTELPVAHCAKSVSFGSSLFLEYQGRRSPDMSCPTNDQRVIDLQKHANAILRAARELTGFPSRRVAR